MEISREKIEKLIEIMLSGVSKIEMGDKVVWYQRVDDVFRFFSNISSRISKPKKYIAITSKGVDS